MHRVLKCYVLYFLLCFLSGDNDSYLNLVATAENDGEHVRACTKLCKQFGSELEGDGVVTVKNDLVVLCIKVNALNVLNDKGVSNVLNHVDCGEDIAAECGA